MLGLLEGSGLTGARLAFSCGRHRVTGPSGPPQPWAAWSAACPGVPCAPGCSSRFSALWHTPGSGTGAVLRQLPLFPGGSAAAPTARCWAVWSAGLAWALPPPSGQADPPRVLLQRPSCPGSPGPLRRQVGWAGSVQRTQRGFVSPVLGTLRRQESLQHWNQGELRKGQACVVGPVFCAGQVLELLPWRPDCTSCPCIPVGLATGSMA